jgi:hypothetical protein
MALLARAVVQDLCQAVCGLKQAGGEIESYNFVSFQVAAYKNVSD